MCYEEKNVPETDRAFEFFMNRFRLLEAVPKTEFTSLTGLAESEVKNEIIWALEKGYLIETETHWQITEQGKLFLNELLERFLSE